VSETTTPPSADNGPESGNNAANPGIIESLTQVNQASQQTLDSATQAFNALGNLLSADVALARSALRKALLWSAVVVVFATTAWLLLILAVTVLMQWSGLPWPVALLLSGLISVIAAFIALHRVRFYLRHTDLAATRRQLAKLHWPPAKTSSANMTNAEPAP